jgi:hypothetical protein
VEEEVGKLLQVLCAPAVLAFEAVIPAFEEFSKSAYVSIRQHPSAYVRQIYIYIYPSSQPLRSTSSLRLHTLAA